MKKYLMLFCLLSAVHVQAATVTLPTDGRLPNKIYGVSRTSMLYSSPWGEFGSSNPAWAITQWVLPRYPYSSTPLPTTYNCNGSCTNGVWFTEAPDGRLKVTGTKSPSNLVGTVYRLKADFQGAKFDACNEYDLLVNADNRIGLNSVVSFASQTSLGASTSYRYRWSQGLLTATSGTLCNSVNGVNYSTSVAGLLFNNQVTGHFLHYQSISYDSRYPTLGGVF